MAGQGRFNPFPPGTRYANYYVPWAESLLDIQPPFVFGQKYLMRKVMERSLCVVEENYTVKMRGRREKKKKENLVSPRVNWKGNRACCQPNSNPTRDLCWVEVGFGRISEKRLQHFPSKQCWFSGNTAKNHCVSWYSLLRPVKDVVWGSLDGHLALLVSLFSVPLKWQCSITAEELGGGQEKSCLPNKGKLFETWDTPPWTRRIPILPELFRGEAILILFPSPRSQVPQFQQRYEDRKPRDGEDKSTLCLSWHLQETWVPLHNCCGYWAFRCDQCLDILQCCCRPKD